MRRAPLRSASWRLIRRPIASAIPGNPYRSARSNSGCSITLLRAQTASLPEINCSMRCGERIDSLRRAAWTFTSAACVKKSNPSRKTPCIWKPSEARAICLKPVRLNLFWKLGFAFFALLIAVLLPVDFYAERALRRDYERAGFEELAAVARIALAHPPQPSDLISHVPAKGAPLLDWVAQMAASGVRVTVIASDGQVLADSQSDPATMENHARRPEIRDAFAKGDGQSIRHSVTVDNNLSD